jgi:hypothetical protein
VRGEPANRAGRRPQTAHRDARRPPRSYHVARRSGPGMPVRLPLPSTRFGDVRRRGFAHLIQRGRGRYSFWIHTLSPPPDFELSALSPGSAYRDDAIRPSDVRDAIRRRIGFREFERSRTCGSRRSRTRYTRHATHGHTPKSAIRSIVVLVVRGVRVGHAKGACLQCRKRSRFSIYSFIQNRIYVIQYKFRLHRVHARHVIATRRPGAQALNHTSSEIRRQTHPVTTTDRSLTSH